MNETNKGQMDRNNMGNVGDSQQGQKRSLRDQAGELLEKAGHKISETGAPSIGQKIHDLGDRVEETHSDKNHPHDV